LSQKQLFAGFDLEPGERLDFDVDCRPWLTGTATMAGFVITPDNAACPVTFEAVSFFESGRLAKFYASVPDGTARAAWRCKVRLTDDQGRVGNQYFQMTVR
jgi:hypothetical protein